MYRALPDPIQSMVIEPVVNQLPASRDTSIGELFRKGQAFVDAGSDDVRQRHFEWVCKNSGDTDSVYLNCDPTSAGSSLIARKHDEVSEWIPDERCSDFTKIMGVDTYHGLPNQMLQKVDLASMYNSLEVRVPFLDTTVVEYALGLPAEYKITARNRKRILKHAFKEILPQKVLSQSKQGFEMPIGNWFKNDLSDDFRSVVSQSTAVQIDTQAVLDLHDQHCRGKHDYEWFLWNMYVFAQWHHRMISKGYIQE